MNQLNVWTTEDIHHECNACGRCCDSGPALSLSELFRFEQVFIGCLALRRVPRLRVGELVGGLHLATQQDVSETESLMDEMYHRPKNDPSFVLEIAIHAFGYESWRSCPALAEDGKCTLHGQGKPLACQCVPFDPAVSDALQRWVLAHRASEAASWGAACIQPSAISPTSIALRRLTVLPPHQRSLAARRRDMGIDKSLWQERLFRHLDVHLQRVDATPIPATGYMLLSLAPVLAAVSDASERCQTRVLQFLDAQKHLMNQTLQAALHRKNRADRADTQLLRSFLEKNRELKSILTRPRAREFSAGPELAQLEECLGVDRPDYGESHAC